MSIFDKYDLVDVDESFEIPEKPNKGMILLVGSSGSGKSTIIQNWNDDKSYNIDRNIPIVSLFDTEANAEKFLISAGLRSIPTWRRTLNSVSNGERHRAEIAFLLSKGNATIDEFTSVVDRNTARALCVSINKCKQETLVLATCHRDVLSWLDFDFAYDTDRKEWLDRGLLRRIDTLSLQIEPCDPEKIWRVFKKHHYLSSKINKSANCWGVFTEGKLIAMTSVIAFPNQSWRNGWRGHRTVVLPEFQGMGIGTNISNEIAKMIVKSGGRFFSKTAHPALGEHRERSREWRATSKNKRMRKDYNPKNKTKEDAHKILHKFRSCYSHEYIGSTV